MPIEIGNLFLVFLLSALFQVQEVINLQTAGTNYAIFSEISSTRKVKRRGNSRHNQ